MKFSSKVEKCGQSPMRKFHPYAVAAKARGIKVYHLNIGQPDVQTPPAFFEAIRKFEQPVLEYAPSPGIPELIDAINAVLEEVNEQGLYAQWREEATELAKTLGLEVDG